MSILSDFEDNVAGLFENVSGSLFRSPVEPVQIVRAAEKEMIKNKLVGAGKTYAPTLYTVLLSPEDDENLNSFYPTLSNESGVYLMGKASEEGLFFAAKPFVRFMVDDGLKIGKFSVIAENVSEEELDEIREEEEEFWGITPAIPEPEAYVPPAAAVPAAAVVPPRPRTPAPVVAPPAHAIPGIDYEDASFVEEEPVAVPRTAPLGRSAVGSLVDLKSGKVFTLAERTTIGRDPASTIVIEDINVSRNHAEVLSEGDVWVVRDLGSTNGTQVNDTLVSTAELRDGDSVTFGVSRYRFREG